MKIKGQDFTGWFDKEKKVQEGTKVREGTPERGQYDFDIQSRSTEPTTLSVPERSFFRSVIGYVTPKVKSLLKTPVAKKLIEKSSRFPMLAQLSKTLTETPVGKKVKGKLMRLGEALFEPASIEPATVNYLLKEGALDTVEGICNAFKGYEYQLSKSVFKPALVAATKKMENEQWAEYAKAIDPSDGFAALARFGKQTGMTQEAIKASLKTFGIKTAMDAQRIMWWQLNFGQMPELSGLKEDTKIAALLREHYPNVDIEQVLPYMQAMAAGTLTDKDIASAGKLDFWGAHPEGVSDIKAKENRQNLEMLATAERIEKSWINPGEKVMPDTVAQALLTYSLYGVAPRNLKYTAYLTGGAKFLGVMTRNPYARKLATAMLKAGDKLAVRKFDWTKTKQSTAVVDTLWNGIDEMYKNGSIGAAKMYRGLKSIFTTNYGVHKAWTALNDKTQAAFSQKLWEICAWEKANQRTMEYYAKNPALETTLREAVRNPKLIKALPKELQPLANKIRGTTDNLVREFVAAGINAGAIPKRYAKTLMKNIGSYLRVRYPLFRDLSVGEKVTGSTKGMGALELSTMFTKDQLSMFDALPNRVASRVMDTIFKMAGKGAGRLPVYLKKVKGLHGLGKRKNWVAKLYDGAIKGMIGDIKKLQAKEMGLMKWSSLKLTPAEAKLFPRIKAFGDTKRRTSLMDLANMSQDELNYYLTRMMQVTGEKSPKRIMGIFAKAKKHLEGIKTLRAKRTAIESDLYRMRQGTRMEALHRLEKEIQEVIGTEPVIDSFIGQSQQQARKIAEYNLLAGLEQNKELWSKVPKTAADTFEPFVQLPRVKQTYGNLAGKFVRKEIYEDLRGWVEGGQEVQKLAPKYIGYYKSLLTSKRFGAHATNTIGNIFVGNTVLKIPLVEMGTQMKNFRNLWVKQPEKITKMIKDYDLFAGLFTGTELNYKLLNDVGRQFRKVKFRQDTTPFGLLARVPKEIKNFYEGMDKAYTLEDIWFRGAFALALKKKGYPKAEIGKLIQSAVFNYGKVPPLVKWSRKSLLGDLFISYPYLAFRHFTPAFLTHPLKFTMWGHLIRTYNYSTLGSMGQTMEEADRTMIDYGGTGGNPVFPMTLFHGKTVDENTGRMSYMTTNLATRLGMGEEVFRFLGGGIVKPVVTKLAMSNPLHGFWLRMFGRYDPRTGNKLPTPKGLSQWANEGLTTLPQLIMPNDVAVHSANAIKQCIWGIKSAKVHYPMWMDGIRFALGRNILYKTMPDYIHYEHKKELADLNRAVSVEKRYMGGRLQPKEKKEAARQRALALREKQRKLQKAYIEKRGKPGGYIDKQLEKVKSLIERMRGEQ